IVTRSRRREEADSDATPNRLLTSAATGKTIIAGYPWFTDWGRDTFIALRGLCIASGRLADARDILLAWADNVSEGMLPNRFPDRGEQAEYNSVDASLWFIVAVPSCSRLAMEMAGYCPPRRNAFYKMRWRRFWKVTRKERASGYAWTATGCLQP